MVKVSVIVPVYNTGKYLKKCLKSLLNQTLDEIEIIVVNDGSTDESQKIIEEFFEKSNKIKAFQKPNGGLSDARNFGLERASGEFIGFVDSDDFVSEEMFEKMYAKAVEHGAEIVLCDLEKVYERGEAFRDLPQSPQLPEKIELEKDFSIFGEMACFACNKLFKKELFENYRFKKEIHFEDIELIPKLVLDSKIIAKINAPFYKYFERQNSITKTHTAKGLDMFMAIQNVKEAFEKSSFKHRKEEFERFFIFQGYYSFLAYVAYVKDKNLKKKMLEELENQLKIYEISKIKIIKYKRFDENYLFSLPIKKEIFYLMGFVHHKLIQWT
ncbi:MAG TPA: glycosyltransferase family 2 protein [Moheibacter sp.]|nr:glycosyltransferase family 2 protein [Moheibacter sp.]